MSTRNEKRVIIMRHEPTFENKNGVIQGQSVASSLERAEISPYKVQWCRENIISPAMIICSSLGRSVHSSQLLSGSLSLPIQISPLLIQRSWGNVEGKSVKELGKEFVKNAFVADKEDLPDGAESLSQVRDRILQVWSQILNFEARTILVVTHDEISNYLINEIFKEGLFKRPLNFSEAHLVDLDRCGSVTHASLNSKISPVSYQRKVLLRNDAPTFKFDEVGVRILNNRGISLLEVTEDVDRDSVEGMIVGDKLFTEQDLEMYPNLKVVSRFGKGTNNIVIKSREGLWVTNTPGCNEKSVAEFTCILVNDLMRGVGLFSRRLSERNLWKPTVLRDYSTMIIGVVGLGAIGREVVRLLMKTGFPVIGWTFHLEKHAKFIEENRLSMASCIEEICSLSDMVTLHIPATKESNGLMGLEQMKLMQVKRGYIINTSRPEILDYKALKKALKRQWISGAALDVFPEEPIKSLWLRQLVCDPRVISTPHVAGKTTGAIRKAIALCAYNVAWVLNGRPESASCINL